MRVEAVIFDLFKTLGDIDSYITDEQISELLVSRGYPVYPQMWRHTFSFVVFIDYPKHGYDSYETLLRQVFNRLELEVDNDTLEKLVTIFKNSHFKIYDESIEAVKKAKMKGLKTAICTTTPKSFFVEEIEPIINYLDYICTGYEAGCEKSNPQIYHKILDQIQAKPQNTVVIGDNPQLDIYNAKQLGLKTIQILKEGKPSTYADDIAVDVSDAVEKLEKE